MTSGRIDDIDDVIKVFENSQWASLPIQINFFCIHQEQANQKELQTKKLLKQIKKYNNEIAGWR